MNTRLYEILHHAATTTGLTALGLATTGLAYKTVQDARAETNHTVKQTIKSDAAMTSWGVSTSLFAITGFQTILYAHRRWNNASLVERAAIISTALAWLAAAGYSLSQGLDDRHTLASGLIATLGSQAPNYAELIMEIVDACRNTNNQNYLFATNNSTIQDEPTEANKLMSELSSYTTTSYQQ